MLKSTSKTIKDEKILDKTTTPASKRKRTPSKEKVCSYCAEFISSISLWMKSLTQ